jgi:hypothetical protein
MSIFFNRFRGPELDFDLHKPYANPVPGPDQIRPFKTILKYSYGTKQICIKWVWLYTTPNICDWVIFKGDNLDM